MPVLDIGETLRLIETGRAGEAVPALEQLATLLPASVTVHVLLARAYEANHSAEQALSEWQWASTLVPNSPIIQEGIERSVRAVARAAHPDAADASTWLADVQPVTPPPEEDEFVDLAARPPASTEIMRRPRTEALRKSISAPVPSGAPPEEYEDLDRLIAELESARITPDPDFAAIPPPDLEDEIDDVVSETLARIYAAQRQYDEAARVYELLAAQQPDRARELLQKAVEMRGLASEE